MSPRLLFVVTEDSFFASHRLPLARAARDAGFSVSVATTDGDFAGAIRREGIELIPFDLSRRGMNPLREAAAVARLAALYRDRRPDIVHHVAFKPIVAGSLAAKLAGVPVVVNTFTGLGYMYSSDEWRARALRVPVEAILRFALRGPGRAVIVQNPDDRRIVSRVIGADPAALDLIRGSGVDPAVYRASAEPSGEVQVAFICRMLWSKGVGEFVEAARQLRSDSIRARFVIVGGTDDGNPNAVPGSQLRAWHAEGAVEWLGRRDDVPAILAASHIVALPSAYGEGVPKILIEAAACARPIIASDIPGCREIVRDGENGLLVPRKRPRELAAALRTLIADPAARRRMGEAGRRLAESEFSERQVIAETLGVYRRELGTPDAVGRVANVV